MEQRWRRGDWGKKTDTDATFFSNYSKVKTWRRYGWKGNEQWLNEGASLDCAGRVDRDELQVGDGARSRSAPPNCRPTANPKTAFVLCFCSRPSKLSCVVLLSRGDVLAECLPLRTGQTDPKLTDLLLWRGSTKKRHEKPFRHKKCPDLKKKGLFLELNLTGRQIYLCKLVSDRLLVLDTIVFLWFFFLFLRVSGSLHCAQLPSCGCLRTLHIYDSLTWRRGPRAGPPIATGRGWNYCHSICPLWRLTSNP